MAIFTIPMLGFKFNISPIAILGLRSRHRTTYSQVSNQCLDFQGHYQQLKINF